MSTNENGIAITQLENYCRDLRRHFYYKLEFMGDHYELTVYDRWWSEMVVKRGDAIPIVVEAALETLRG